MSGLRTRIEDAIIVHTERCDCCPLVDKPQKLADVVLRVLAEHGDTQQVREQMDRLLFGDQVAEVMAVVAPIVAARDAAVERAESEAIRATTAEKILVLVRQKVVSLDGAVASWCARAEHAEVSEREAILQLAAARQQLDQLRALCSEGPFLTPEEILAILDAPARPAGHDETGQ